MNDYVEKNDHDKRYILELEYTKTTLLERKSMYLIRGFEIENNKQYLKSVMLIADGLIYALNYAESQHFMEELNLFEHGNAQNIYFQVKEHQGIINLELDGLDQKVYISKSEARTIYKIFEKSFWGYSINRLLEDECELSYQSWQYIINKRFEDLLRDFEYTF